LSSARGGDLVIARFTAGENVHASILALCRAHRVEGGLIVSGIGALADPVIGYFAGDGNYVTREFPGIHECLSLTGNLSTKDGELMAHLHAIMSDTEFHAFGGHLVKAQVGITLELAISVVGEPVRMYREIEPETGLPGLKIE
jgi:predicted DNA-binding protein with PD1-like motif